MTNREKLGSMELYDLLSDMQVNPCRQPAKMPHVLYRASS